MQKNFLEAYTFVFRVFLDRILLKNCMDLVFHLDQVFPLCPLYLVGSTVRYKFFSGLNLGRMNSYTTMYKCNTTSKCVLKFFNELVSFCIQLIIIKILGHNFIIQLDAVKTAVFFLAQTVIDTSQNLPFTLPISSQDRIKIYIVFHQSY